jgi:hypothetical protein
MVLNDFDSRGSYEMTFGLRNHSASAKTSASQRNPHEELAPLMAARLQAAQSSGCSFARSACDLVSVSTVFGSTMVSSEITAFAEPDATSHTSVGVRA